MLPELKPSARSREFNIYSDPQRSEVIKQWILYGTAHRKLDEKVLGLDPVYSRGFQSMGILHYLGLKKEYQGIFTGKELEEAIIELEEDGQDFNQILFYLKSSAASTSFSLDQIRQAEEKELKESRQDSAENRQSRLSRANPKPQRIKVYSYTYKRNPDVVAESLERANGICEKCSNPAPFMRLTDGTPFLEVHHIISLSKGGLDSVDNVIALCPNCHQELHHG